MKTSYTLILKLKVQLENELLTPKITVIKKTHLTEKIKILEEFLLISRQ